MNITINFNTKHPPNINYMRREGENLDNMRGHTNRVAPLPFTEEAPEEGICRICMEPESKDLCLITPCKCSGSVKYIHEECLKTWIISQEGDIDDAQCELCHTPFIMEFKIGRQCAPGESVKNGWSPLIYLPVLIAVMLMLFLVIYLLANRYINISQGNTDQGYTVALMVTCGISGMVLFLLITNTLKELCFVMRLEAWHIFSQNFSHESEESVKEIKDETMVLERTFNSVLIVPENLIVKGVKVKTPIVAPNLTVLNQRGKVVGYAPRAYSPVLNPSASISIPQRLNTDPCHHS